MPLNFPSSPANGQVYMSTDQVWQYDSTLGKWKARKFMPVEASATPPTGQEGKLWFDTTDGTLMIYYGSAWVEVSGSSLPSAILQTADLDASVQRYNANILKASDLGVLVAKKAVVATMQSTASGTSKDFTSLPSGIRQIEVCFNGVSTNGTSSVQVQLGDATTGGYITSGYAGRVGQAVTGNNSVLDFTTGFGIRAGAAVDVRHGIMTLCLANPSTNEWYGYHGLGLSNASNTPHGFHRVTLAGELDRLRITTVNGTDAFDAGNVNIRYSF